MFKSSNVSHTFSKTHVFFCEVSIKPCTKPTAYSNKLVHVSHKIVVCNPAVSKIAFHASAVFGPRAGLDGNPHDPPGNPPDVPGGFLGVDGSPQSSKLTKPWSLIFFCRLFCFRLRIFFKRTCVCLCIHCEKHVLGGFREIPDGHAYELPRTSKNQRGVYTFFFEF